MKPQGGAKKLQCQKLIFWLPSNPPMMIGPILRVGFTIIISVVIILSFTIGVIGLYELCPEPCDTHSVTCPACTNIGDFNLKVIIPYALSLIITTYGLLASWAGMCMTDRLERNYNSCCSDDCAISDKDCLCRWASFNLIALGLLIIIDTVVVVGFYASNSTWNYSALCWIMVSTHAMSTTISITMWLPYMNRCCRKKDYEPIPTTIQ